MIYKDDHIIALNKPNGLSTQSGAKVGQNVDRLLQGIKKLKLWKDKCLFNNYIIIFPFSKHEGLKFDHAEKPKIVHRLDKDTSGILILARDGRVAKVLSELLAPSTDDTTPRIQKTYLAFCHGVPTVRSGVVSNFLTRAHFGDSDRIIVADQIRHGQANRKGDTLRGTN